MKKFERSSPKLAKRLFPAFLTFLLCPILAFVVSAQSYAVIGSVLVSDIRTYINGYEIPSYNVDGKMIVVCSDLKNYGFQTAYDDHDRRTQITLNTKTSDITPITNQSRKRGQIGSKVMDVYETDITVEVNGRPVTAFNVNNQMAIPFSELREFGEYTYDNGSRSAQLFLKGSYSRKEPAEKEDFYIEEISDELFDYMWGKSYKTYCTVPREDLRHLVVLYIDFNGEKRTGELVCNYRIANDLLEIFRELYEAEYPIEQINLVDEFNADDEQSMKANNTSCFNFRYISQSNLISKHGYGLAVDINPLYNPCVRVQNGGVKLEPSTAGKYADRTKDFSYKIDKNDLCYQLFIEHGFVWGGSWKNPKDYQHFEFPN